MRKIECEGCDGAGKTTGLKYLIEKLQGMGKSVVETREVGSPLVPINVKLRELVLDPASNLSGQAMELVFSAMRFEHDKFLKQESVQSSDFVVSDRGWLSHLAYTDHNVNPAFTEGLYLNFLQQHTQLPDIIIYFNVNTETALKRRISRGSTDVIEMKGVEFQEKVRSSFEKYMSDTSLASTQIYTVDANQDIEGVRLQLDKIIEAICGQ